MFGPKRPVVRNARSGARRQATSAVLRGPLLETFRPARRECGFAGLGCCLRPDRAAFETGGGGGGLGPAERPPKGVVSSHPSPCRDRTMRSMPRETTWGWADGGKDCADCCFRRREERQRARERPEREGAERPLSSPSSYCRPPPLPVSLLEPPAAPAWLVITHTHARKPENTRLPPLRLSTLSREPNDQLNCTTPRKSCSAVFFFAPAV